MTLSNKKTNRCDRIDRISDLSNDIIGGILENLNIRDLVRTSILSRKWRYMWISVPQLEFDRDFFNRYGHLDDPGPEISRSIAQVLSIHNGPIHKFTIFIPYNTTVTISSEDLRTWILFLSEKGIKYLELMNHSMDPGKIPFHVFSCQELTYLKLGGFYMQVLPNLCGLKSLLVLHLEDITITSDALQSLISGCPLLEELTISLCYGFECIDFSSPTLKVLRIAIGEEINSICLEKIKNLIDLTLLTDRDSVSDLIKSLPEIQRLAMEPLRREVWFADMVPPSLLTNSFSSLKYLKLMAVDLNDREELLYIVSVIKSASNLVELIIESYSDVDYATQGPEHLEELESIGCCLSQLQMVEITVKASCQNAMSLIQLILANSPLLDTLTFSVYGLSSNLSDAPMMVSILLDLLRMKRSSQRARVEFFHG